MIYLDYNATTPLAPEVLDAMRPYLERHFGNPSSIHAAGRETRAAIDDARDLLARLLGAKAHEIIFTGGGTESDNLAVLGLARSRASAGKHVITCATEHHAVLHAFEHLQKKEGFRVTWLPVDRGGRIDLQQLSDAITPQTTLVSIMTANNETGTLQPVREIAALCRARGVLFHSDAIQSFGKEPLDARDFDALSLAAHKFHGPVGAGLLYLRAGISIESIQHGGSHENQRRPGTENVAAIAGMARAAELAVRDLDAEARRQAALRDRLWSGINTGFPAAVMNGDPAHRLANTLNVSFPGLDGESLLINLDLAGICASSGSACMVGSIVPSHVLLAMGAPPEHAGATVRFSLGKGTTAREIDETLERLPEIFARLQPQPV
ncbi:MAG TPA: cysteine desulfurase family protein [Chthoniobacteraceae bacterium]|nr:cysteine desulfurase family protein [Chthoniobacteraceae bacterium]